MAENTKIKTPLFHIVSRGKDSVSWYFGVFVRAAAIIFALALSGLIIMLLSGNNPIAAYGTMFDGVFGTDRRIWIFLQNTAFLLCVSLAVTPAFKMKFWNCGAEGQALMGGLATVMVMLFLGDKLPYPVLMIVMVAASILAGVLWAVIPAVFKALFNTNETLFTLMMNYVAIQLVAYFLKVVVKDASGVLDIMPQYGLPTVVNKYMLNIIVVAALTVIMYIYLKYSKQGYEISVVGESQNTAKYIGIGVKKVIIRTLVVSGALCGIAGLLLAGGFSHTISTTTVDGRGFTAIMVSWLGKFNPFYIALTSSLVVFLDQGAGQLYTKYKIPESISDIVTGIILLSIIGCEFFLRYKIVFTKRTKEGK